MEPARSLEDALPDAPRTPEQWLELAEADTIITRAYASLTPREERVLRMRFEQALTWREISEHFGVTLERVRQIGDRAIRKLRHPTRAGPLREAAELVGLHYDRPPRYTPPAHQPWHRYTHFTPPPPRPAPRLEPLDELPQWHTSLPALLQLPLDWRDDGIKRLIAWRLEHLFMQRGSGDLIIHTHDELGRRRSQLEIELRKYDYIMANLHWLWDRFPPRPAWAPREEATNDQQDRGSEATAPPG